MLRGVLVGESMTAGREMAEALLRDWGTPARKGACQDCVVLDAVSGKRKCSWCAMLKLSPDEQMGLAAERRSLADPSAPRTRPAKDWPPGMRWCGSCRSYVGLRYVSGSRCHGCDLLSRRERDWGFTSEQTAALGEQFGDGCAICGNHQRIKSRAVDHRHADGLIRGFLCQGDNGTIGDFHDDARRFLAAAVYLVALPAQRTLNPGTTPTNREVAVEIVRLLKEILEEKPYK